MQPAFRVHLHAITRRKKIYFASDFHLGIPDKATSRAREQRLCRWLESIRHDAAVLYLVGDIFDAWFEYKHVVPKGYTRFLGKLAELSDSGIVIEAFTGNHDLWMRGYFEEELNIPVHHMPIRREYNGKQFLIAHGDGLGPGDRGYKNAEEGFAQPFISVAIPKDTPRHGVGVAGWLSRLGPKHTDGEEEQFLGPEKEWLVQFCLETLKVEHVDYFIFGHRHIAIEYPLPQNSLYVNLGDWLRYNSYAVFDGSGLRLKFYKEEK